MLEALAPEQESLAVVVVGSLPPALLQPSRLARVGLIRDLEADGAKVNVVSNDFTQFSTDWFSLEALPDRLQISTELSAYYPFLRDLMVGLIQTTPTLEVTGVGVNHSAHFAVAEEPKWHKLGHVLAPKDFWSTVLKNPGTRRVAVQGERADGYSGVVNLTFEPSMRVRPGIFVSSNDHYNVRQDSEKGDSSAFAAQLIEENFPASLTRSTEFFREMLKYADSIEGNG